MLAGGSHSVKIYVYMCACLVLSSQLPRWFNIASAKKERKEDVAIAIEAGLI